MLCKPYSSSKFICSSKLLVVYTVISIILYGCAVSVQNEPYPYYNSSEIEVMHDLIKEGRTTESALLKQLGRPTSEGTDNLGRKKWMYLSNPNRGKEVRLDVIFDKNGVVTDYRLDGGNGGFFGK
jgi:outer membrane protein assembly factor BamE (lipoprotein component of BamABCDE complex)